MLRLGNIIIATTKEVKGLIDKPVTKKELYREAKIRVQEYLKKRLKKKVWFLVSYGNREATMHFNGAVKKENEKILKKEEKIKQKFAHVYEVIYHWEHVPTDDGLEVNGKTEGEIFANTRFQAQQVANGHGWVSSQAHIIEQSAGALTELILIKAVINQKK